MYPQWIPQNLQKRLLLYILQQLSLFSEIDLPNLEEVSLNNIHLKDVSIDPEKVGKLPGCNLRSGKLCNIELSGGVVGGVNFDVIGVDLVFAPNIDNLDEEIKHVQFSLAQSTADLANTVMKEDKDDKDEDDTDTDSDHTPQPKLSRSGSVSSFSSKKSSALGGVMSRAVEIALLRLLAKIQDINIKFVSEPTDILIHIDEISFVANNGTRCISVKGVRVSTIKPHVNAGHRPKLATQDTSSPSTESEDDDYFDYGEESLMDSMVFTHEEASSIYMSATSQSFNGAAHAEAKKAAEAAVLLFVDTITLEFEGLSPISNLNVDIGTINIAAVPLLPTASLVFNSISKMLKLKNHQLRKQNVARKFNKANSKFPEYENEDDDVLKGLQEDSVDDDPAFDKLHISNIVIGITSAITPDGTFASTSDDLSIVLNNLNVKQKSHDLVYGGVEVFKILRHFEGTESTIFRFEASKLSLTPTPVDPTVSPPPSSGGGKADVRFELFKKIEDSTTTSEITALLSKPASVKLDSDSLQYLLNFAKSIGIMYQSMSTMLVDVSQLQLLTKTVNSRSAPELESNSSKSLFILQTASINIDVKLLVDVTIKAVIFPLTYNKLHDRLLIQRIIFSSLISDEEKLLLNIPNITMHTALKEFKSFQSRAANSMPREVTTQSQNTVSTGKVSGSITFKDLKLINRAVSRFGSSFLQMSLRVNALSSAIDEKDTHSSKGPISGSIANSIYSNQRRFRRLKTNNTNSVVFGETKNAAASFRLLIELVEFTITDLFPRFGNMELNVGHTEFSVHNGDVQGFIKTVDVKRVHDNGKVNESFFRKFENQNFDTTKSPIVLFTYKSNEKGSITDIVVRGFFIEYYTHWLLLLEKDVTQGHTAEEIVHVTTPTGPKSSKKADVRFTFHDFALGLTPGRLTSKLCLTIKKGNSDFTFGNEQFYIKSSFRELSLLLIDDREALKSLGELHVQGSDLSPYTSLISDGFVPIGLINTSHVGITVNTDVEEVKKRNERLGIWGNLSLLDLKINSDEHQIDLCADSAHFLMQTINDLKTPVLFREEEKFRVEVNEGFSFGEELGNEIKIIQEGGLLNGWKQTPIPEQQPTRKDSVSSDFLIVDEYYNEPDTLDGNLEQGISKLSVEESSKSNSEISSLSFADDHFSEKSQGKEIKIFPVSLNMNLSKTKIYFHDGYDWKQTRKSLRRVVKNMEAKAALQAEKKRKKKAATGDSQSTIVEEGTEIKHNEVRFEDEEERISWDDEEDYESDDLAVNETLYQSIHLSLPRGVPASELVKSINSQVQSENRSEDSDKEKNLQINVNVEKHYKDLKLKRSAYHKILVDLKNIEVNVTNFTSRDPRNDETPYALGSEIINQIDFRLESITVYDNVPTSTWNKVLTYMNILGEREVGTSMVQCSITNVRPDPKLAYTEAVIHVKLLPIRLYIDQDTLAFLSRFFEFKDSRVSLPADEVMYIQKLVIDPIKLKFDYKPKKVDYAGIRAGNNAELANFFILDGSDISLKKAIVYGVLGFPKLGSALKDIYGPYIQKYQLAGILSGLAPVRSIVNIGGGMKDLVAIPVKEYKKDGRLLRSIQKGTSSFAKTTTYELLKLGVKLASGTQVMLENSEEFFGGEGTTARRPRKDSIKKPINDDDLTNVKRKPSKKPSLLESSQILKKTVTVDKDTYASQKLYSNASLDDVNEDETLDFDELQSSILVFSPANKSATPDEGHLDGINEEEEDEDEIPEKMVSLYSNQPSSTKEGLKLAYKSLGRNLKSTKKTIVNLKNELQDAESFQELISSIARSSPIIVIRPMIGTTEAVMKALMGLSNEIDAKYMVETQDKYRNEKPGQNEP